MPAQRTFPNRLLLFALLLSALCLSSCETKHTGITSTPKPTPGSPYQYQFIYGRSVILPGKYAVAPKSAPPAVHRAVAAGNRLQGKPYIYGGGHRGDINNAPGYDCSSTTSYMLIHAGLLTKSMTSGDFMNYGLPGPGKWITIYAKRGHVFSTIGGLRLDTGYGGGDGPRWHTKSRPTKGYVMRHPPGL